MPTKKSKLKTQSRSAAKRNITKPRPRKAPPKPNAPPRPAAKIAVVLKPIGLRVKIGDAMRSLGLDEPRLARLLRGLLRRLNKPKSEKLLLEAVKEMCRLLEAYPASRPAASGSGGAPSVPVVFVTMAPRPERSEPRALDAPASDAPSAPIDESVLP